jgi:hypothetical protein
MSLCVDRLKNLSSVLALLAGVVVAPSGCRDSAPFEEIDSSLSQDDANIDRAEVFH